MFPWLLLGAAALASGGNRGAEPKEPERMDYDQALKQATDILTPQYEKSRKDVMSRINNNLISRGFYGQAPGDALRAKTMGNMETDFTGQLANYATNLQNNRYTQDYQSYLTQLDQYNQPDPFWGGIGGLAGQFMAGPGGKSLFDYAAKNWFS